MSTVPAARGAARAHGSGACRSYRHAGAYRLDSGLGGEIGLKGFQEGTERTAGLIVVVHGSGSSRFSVRNNQVAQFLRDRGFATLLMDLLTADEDEVDAITRELCFDISEFAGVAVAHPTSPKPS